ncbi:hypothetical protein RAH32_06140 [Paracoccus sp. WLY502]|uniref:hypothetical protein n=1 Tax=Paracoccus yibinensis TaxID=3068891 RepID=UPI0027969B37|nr:hypothetical protein [Paracoccus sp. WLY502]MDQ1900020.1 hypothetical protein [Paracoccus sp. WLY502]
MSDSPSEYLYRADLRRSHELSFDLMCYGSTLFPAFDGTLSTTIAIVIRKLTEFAPAARRILHLEQPCVEIREKLLTTNPRYKTEGHRYPYVAIPVIWALNGIIHAKDIWVNHLRDSENQAWQPNGAFHLIGFGFETDQRRVEHVDLFAFANGYLSRPGHYMNDFFERKGRG